MSDLFGDDIPPPLRRNGARFGPKGGKHYVRPSGYIAMPGTGPAGKTCRDCRHCVRACYTRSANRWPKCELNQARWTGGRGSDILVSSPACSRFEPKEPS